MLSIYQVMATVTLSSIVVPFVCFVCVSGMHQAGATDTIEAMLSGARCEATVRNQVRAWDGNLTDALPDPPAPTGSRSARVPTSAIGLWVRVVEESRREIAIERITATRIERLRFDEDCSPGEYVVATPQPAPGAFSDSALIARIARGDRGVILLWSPHMPLSVDQHAVLASVAGEMGLATEALVDPAADMRYAEALTRERNLAPSALRPLGGIELAFRGMTTHTPSLQLFAGGKLIGPVLYGYRGAAALRATLEETLAGR